MPRSSSSNPYVVGPPLDSEVGFFGREDIIQDVERALRYPNHNSVILYGQRRIGKTSLLLQLERHLPAPPFFSVYFDLAGQELVPVSQVLYQMAAAAAQKATMLPPSPEDFRDNPAAFHEIFLPALYQALGSERQPVFLLDEFNILSQPEQDLPETAAIRGLDEYLYNLLSHQSYTDFVFAAGRRMEELSAVVQSNFKPDLVRFVSVLNREQGRALILQDGIAYEEEAIERILSLSRGHPYLTQLLCHTLFERAVSRSRQKPQVTVADIEAVLPDLLKSKQHDLPLIWASIPLTERITLAAAASRAGEKGSINQAVLENAIRQAGISPETRGLSLAPQNLVNWQLLEQSGGDYSFYIELMRRWVAQERPLERAKNEPLIITPALENARPSRARVKEKGPAQSSPAEIAKRARPQQKGQGRRWPGATGVLVILLAVLLLVCGLGGYALFGTNGETALWNGSSWSDLLGGFAFFGTSGESVGTTREAIAPTPITSLVGGGAATATSRPAETGLILPTTPTNEAPTESIATATNQPSQATTESNSTVQTALPTTPVEEQLTGQIRVVGSTTMQPLIQALAFAFTRERPQVQIIIQGGGSQAGLAAVRQGVADAGMVSRALDASEADGLEIFTLVQSDVIAVIVHPLLLLDNLTTAQVRAIFAGEITNWSEVGGPAAPILVINRPEGSGTRAVFEQTVMGQPGLITDSAIVENSSRATRDIVASQPYAIGYVALNMARQGSEIPQNLPNWAVIDYILLDVKLLSLDGIAPTIENALNGSYPLARPLNIVTQSPPGELIQEGLNFIFSPAGQQVIAEAGYIPTLQ
jgi:phosphate transport system substrate-binding protein